MASHLEGGGYNFPTKRQTALNLISLVGFILRKWIGTRRIRCSQCHYGLVGCASYPYHHHLPGPLD
jgi:hypothetical protein